MNYRRIPEDYYFCGVWFRFKPEYKPAETQNRTVEKKLNLENRPGWLYEPARLLKSASVTTRQPVPKAREAKRNVNWYDRNREGGDR